MTFHIKKAGKDDHPALVRFMSGLQDAERALFSNRLPGEGWAGDHMTYLENLAADTGGAVFIAFDDETPVGMIVTVIARQDGIWLIPEWDRTGDITDLFVMEEYRGSEAAALLMKAAEDHFKTNGVNIATLSFLENNHRARHFYEKCGYAPYERQYFKKLV